MVAELILMVLVALLLAWIFSVPLGRPGPWGGFWWFFVVVFLGTWAVAAWTEPVGPAAYGVSWAPILVAGLLLALFVAAIPPRRPLTAGEAVAEAEAATVLGVFFWFLLLGFVLVILLSFLF